MALRQRNPETLPVALFGLQPALVWYHSELSGSPESSPQNLRPSQDDRPCIRHDSTGQFLGNGCRAAVLAADSSDTFPLPEACTGLLLSHLIATAAPSRSKPLEASEGRSCACSWAYTGS